MSSNLFCKWAPLKHSIQGGIWRSCKHKPSLWLVSSSSTPSGNEKEIHTSNEFRQIQRWKCIWNEDKLTELPGGPDKVCYNCYRTFTTSNLRSLPEDTSEDDRERSNNEGKTESVLTDSYDHKGDPFFTSDIAFGSKENKGLGAPERPVFVPPEENASDEDLTPPSNCCQSGCPNCVWIEYVEKLSKKYSDPRLNREKVLKELDALEDENIKAFIMMELRVKKLI